jgi:hypothetical protein
MIILYKNLFEFISFNLKFWNIFWKNDYFIKRNLQIEFENM